ncbi:serine O-acetyltransferase [Microbacterium sp. HMWF026]|uniref:serine O-acetyltransferase n=1 Tax=Microbacterium sp. HMWF026 TaxID=2056861 RepID=UPI001C6292AC|nr:hypothetical protein [Microbacterium sp. HMWF026]
MSKPAAKTTTRQDNDPLNFEEKLVRSLASRWKRPFAWRLLKWRGIEFPTTVPFGDGLRLAHGAVGLVVHESVILGSRVKLFQGVTLGRGDQYLYRDQLPTGGGILVGDDVIIGAGATILFRSGETTIIGDGAVIGANSVVTRSVPAGEVWAGLPAKRVGDNPNFLGREPSAAR